MLDVIISLDVKLMYILNVGLKNPIFDVLMPVFHDGNVWRIPLILLWLALMIFGGARGRWAGLAAVFILILTDQFSSHIVKPLVGRIRPCNVLGNIWLWRNSSWMLTPDPVIEVYKSSFSFTSSHATNTAGQAFWWSFIYPKFKWFWIPLAAIIGYSRIYDGVHYPFDVVMGWVLGGICFLLIWIPAKRWGPKSLREIPGGKKENQDAVNPSSTTA